MKALTLRNLPSELSQAIRAKAQAAHLSMNRAVISLLAERIGLGASKTQRHHDLDRFAGKWSASESKAFDRSLSDQRAIDPGLWK